MSGIGSELQAHLTKCYRCFIDAKASSLVSVTFLPRWKEGSFLLEGFRTHKLLPCFPDPQTPQLLLVFLIIIYIPSLASLNFCYACNDGGWGKRNRDMKPNCLDQKWHSSHPDDLLPLYDWIYLTERGSVPTISPIVFRQNLSQPIQIHPLRWKLLASAGRKYQREARAERAQTLALLR